ncbi:MAG: hypothetical protein AB1696_28115 [Planctomycetota bacterium]
MRHRARIGLAMALVALVALAGCERDGSDIRAGRLTLALSPDAGRISGLRDVPAAGEGGVYWFDGASGKEVIPRADAVHSGAEQTTFALVGEPTLRAECVVQSGDRLATWHIKLTNTGDAQRLIELRLGLPLAVNEQWEYWDGYDGDQVEGPTRTCAKDCNFYACNAAPSVPRGADPEGRKRAAIKWHTLGGTCIFPLNVVCSDKKGIALGIAPDRPMSHYAGGVQPSASARESFYYAVKLVVDPGKSEECTFVVFGFDPKYGYRKAIEIYQHHFAEAFRVREGLDPRIMLPANGTFLSTHRAVAEMEGAADLWREFCRRYRTGWTWLYAAFQQTGDFWPEADTFDAKRWRQPQPDSPKTAEEFQRIMAEANRAARTGCAVGYYIIPQRCATELADALYADARVVRTDGSFHRSGAVIADEPLTTMFAMNNSFGQNCEREIDRILHKACVDGIAFDNAFAHDMHTGGGMKESEGRAFYDGKPYILNALAYRHLMEEVRNTDCRTPDGFHPAVFANGPYNLFTAQATDAALIEYHPYPPSNVAGHFAALRYLLGSHKPISFKVHGRSTGATLADKQAPPQDEIDVQMNLRLWSLLHMLRWGAYPRVREALGSADLIAAIPVLVELRRAGWQPVSAVTGGGDLWIERFGAGADTRLVVINPTEKPFAGTLTFDHIEAGLGPTTFERIYGDSALDSRIEGEQSLLRLSIAPSWFQVLKAKSDQTPNQHPVRFLPSREAVRDWPYLADGKADFTLPVAPADEGIARSVQGYFAYLQLADTFEMWFMTNGRTPMPDPKTVTVPKIVHINAKYQGERRLAFAIDEGAATPSVEVAGNEEIILRAKNSEGLRAATDALLRLLDERFPRFGYDGWMKRFPKKAGELAPGSTLFRRYGWREFLAFMQERYTKRGEKE